MHLIFVEKKNVFNDSEFEINICIYEAALLAQWKKFKEDNQKIYNFFFTKI